MRVVARPVFDAENTFDRCISKVRDGDLKRRLKSITKHIAEAAALYKIRAQNEELHLIAQSDDVAGIVTKKEMVDVYDGRMVRKDSPGRSIYNTLKSLPDHGICPFCDHGLVSTLDHILPKTAFPELAVTPDNLVGACKDCNTAKLATAPTKAENAPLHPYFDNISHQRWLGAQVIEGKVAAVVFHVAHVDVWSEQLNARIQNQFERLNLGLLYASQAACVISGRRKNLTSIFDASGENGVHQALHDESRSWENYGFNCWQAVTYRVLSASDWYCSGGFKVQ